MFSCDSCGEFDETQVLNLKNAYGKTYKIGWEAGEYHGSRCPWHMIIVCKYGHIAPSGNDSLWVSADRQGASRKLLQIAEEDDRVMLRQDGDDGVSVAIHKDDFRLITAIMQPLA